MTFSPCDISSYFFLNPFANANAFKLVSVITTPNLLSDSVSPVKIPFNAVVTSSMFMFLNDDKSPAKPTNCVDNPAASLVDNPMDVAMSPNNAAISKAVPSAIPNDFNVVLANASTSYADPLNATSTLFNDSLKSFAKFTAAPPANAKGAVNDIDKFLPMFFALSPNSFRFLSALDNAASNSFESPLSKTFNILSAMPQS